MSTELQHENHHYFSAYIRGEEDGFNWFFRQYYPALCLYALQLVKQQAIAEEIAASAFLQVWQQQPALQNADHLLAYLYTTTKHSCFKHLQQQTKQQQSLQYLRQQAATADAPDVLEQLIRAEFSRQLYQSFNRLPQQCRTVISKLVIEGKSVKETAAELKRSLSTIKAQKSRAIHLLRKLASKKEKEELG